jgi:FlgD Ig-like domain/NHL repeat
VRRTITTLISLTLTAGSLHAGTFDKTPILPDQGVEALNRGVARQQIGRTLFGDPYATVSIGHVDVYDVAPYLEARRFQIVSDPRWNRLVFGEVGRSLHAFDGAGTPLGALRDPRGLAVDESDRVYVADAGGNRVLVLQAVTEFGDVSLVPLYEITGLGRPFGVAYSDGGTPFVSGDDMLYVADTGHNRVVAYTLEAQGARQVAELGDLGSGVGHFAGPMAVTVGRSEGVSTSDLYVADAHTQRIVHLKYADGAFQWVAAISHDADIVTSLDTDQWGNVYAAAPNRGVVRKYNPDLVKVAEISDSMQRPRDFHVPFMTLNDHRDGRRLRLGQPNGVLVEQWSDQSGMKLWNLGVEIDDLAMSEGDAPAANFALTDRARVTMEVTDPASGRLVLRRTTDPLAAGFHTLGFTAEDLEGAAGAQALTVRLTAASSYPDGPSAVALATFHLDGSSAMILPSRPVLLGNTPNPFRPATRIAFLLPAGADRDARLRVFDAQGRVVRTFDRAFTPGRNEVVWDGTNDAGLHVSAGVYFYRLDVAADALTQKMVLVR